MKSDVEGLSEGSEEVRDELRTSVGSDMGGSSMFREYMQEEELCELGRRCYSSIRLTSFQQT